MRKQGSDIIVRPLHPNDVPAIYHLLHHASVIGNIPYTPGTELSPVTEWLARHDAGAHRYVALVEGEISGLVMLTHKLRPRLNHTGAITMAAHATNHYAETRQALLATALDLADNWLNLYRLELELSTAAKMDLDFCQSIGFEVEGTRKMAAFRDGTWLNLLFLARLRSHPQWLVSSQKPESANTQDTPARSLRQVKEIEIRPPTPSDVNAYYEMLRDPAICRTTLQLPSQEIWLTEERLSESKPWIHRFAAVADGQVVGSITLVEQQGLGQTHIARIGMNVHSDYWGLGIGYRLMKAVTDLADNWLKTTRIELDVNTDNIAGIRLYQKAGFIIEGTKRFHGYGDGRWADSYFMARIQKK